MSKLVIRQSDAMHHMQILNDYTRKQMIQYEKENSYNNISVNIPLVSASQEIQPHHNIPELVT